MIGLLRGALDLLWKKVGKTWEKVWRLGMCFIWWLVLGYLPKCGVCTHKSALKIARLRVLGARVERLCPQIPVDFHEFPWHPCSHDEDGTKSEALRPPISSQVSYRHPLSSKKRDPVRGRAEHPPRWHAQLDYPQKRDEGGGLISGSRSIRRFASGPGEGRDNRLKGAIGSGAHVSRRKS